MENYIESILERYVIATLDNPTRYLVFQNGNVSFTKYISRATKTAGIKTAQNIRNEFYICTGESNIDLVVLPIRISYEIVREDVVNEGEEYELLS